ncbi:hypothetical protein JCM9279_004827 [Rhodotorula babjevae]
MHPSTDRLDGIQAKLEQLRVEVDALPQRTDLSAAQLADLANAESGQSGKPQQAPQVAALGVQTRPAAVVFSAKPPRVYYGSRSWRKYNVYKFIDQITAYAAATIGEIDDAQRVRVCASYMRGAAWSWYSSHVYLSPYSDVAVKPEPAWASDFELFKKELVVAFGDPYKKEHDGERLIRLRQTGSASQYATQFRRLASSLDWCNTMLRMHFHKGLKNEFKRALVPHPQPNSLDELIKWVLELDQRINYRWR